MARKKIVFVIVEGPSDQDALEVLLQKIFADNKVFVAIVYGDITSEIGNTSSNILSRVTELVRKYAANNHLDKIHFQEVIHIMDTDGAYIDDVHIVEEPDTEGTFYTLTDIRTDDIEKIRARNDRKRKNMNKLSETPTIWGSIPYSAYYMSCNLDHVLYNRMNSTDKDKERDSHRFAKQYKDRIPEFVKFISESEFSVTGDYMKTWEYIREDVHSLERHTNLGLAFPAE